MWPFRNRPIEIKVNIPQSYPFPCFGEFSNFPLRTKLPFNQQSFVFRFLDLSWALRTCSVLLLVNTSYSWCSYLVSQITGSSYLSSRPLWSSSGHCSLWLGFRAHPGTWVLLRSYCRCFLLLQNYILFFRHLQREACAWRRLSKCAFLSGLCFVFALLVLCPRNLWSRRCFIPHLLVWLCYLWRPSPP